MPQKVKTLFIPENSSELQEKFINYIMLGGKKSIARAIFSDTLEALNKKGHKAPVKVFEKALENIKPSLEVKAKRIGGAVYQIPMEVKPHRQITLAFRWLIKSARDKKGKEMANKLAEEIEQAADNQGNAIKKKEDTHKMAKANKAFAHYARY
ncbi:MAG: 30S ribosomal protein S7 [Candidatus Peregrinibacteria bacterium GW2011_GWA2_33_10]|nr:MAG: 30S ribosomal protein S7 [Candidatus Peregrinibacteria bacterium GW2011_GWA2_33_10]KKP40761.1 MAG: 30S ribosomal protein S7, small subunit ribosomal protein S7 [Candidatus Peregrinibacteria bacterium GW2011_GWC2_33_13]